MIIHVMDVVGKVAVDSNDNIVTYANIDIGQDMIIKYTPDGQHILWQTIIDVSELEFIESIGLEGYIEDQQYPLENPEQPYEQRPDTRPHTHIRPD